MTADQQDYRSFFENAALGMARVAPDGRWLEVNAFFPQWLGYGREELSALTFRDITHPDDQQRDVEAAQRLRRGDISRYETDKRYRRKDGSYVWAHLTTSLLRRDNGSEYFVSIVQPLSDDAAALAQTTRELQQRTEALVLAERASRAAREDLVRTLEQVPLPIAVLSGSRHVFTLANPAYLALVNREVMGQAARDVLPEVEQHFFDLLKDVYATGKPYTASEVPITLAVRAGAPPERRYVNFLYQPIRNERGEVDGIIAVGMDVSSLVEARQNIAASEEHLRRMLDALPTLAWTAKGDGYIDWYNARWYEFTGTTPEAMQGWGWQSVHHPETLPKVLARWQASIATGEPFEMTFPLRGANGQFRQFLTRVSPVRDAEGTVVRWFGTNTDVDTEHAARAAAEQARTLAEEANAAKMHFLATMSHELRTPLNAIGGYAELLALGIHGEVNESQRDTLQRIMRSQRHLLGLINDVLNFAKLEAGSVVYDLADVALCDAMDGLEPLVLPQLHARRLTFVREPMDGIIVRADLEKLQQILINLLSNAIKYTQPGGRITVRCRVDGGMAAVDIEDTGIGIAPERREQIFAPFVQVNRGLTSTEEGTGLGLSISRDLARGMNGDITVTSEPGRGSTFTLLLPVAGKND